MAVATSLSPASSAQFVKDNLPKQGLFAGHEWRVAPAPLSLGASLSKELDGLGRVLLQFYRAVNLLYRKSVEGKQPSWVSTWLDQGKPRELIELQRSPALKNEVPRVIRPDLLLTEQGLSMTELDSVPGGIGLTGWLNRTYASIGFSVLGGQDGMLRGFESIFGDASRVNIVVSEEAATYRPEMEWMADQLGSSRFRVVGPGFSGAEPGEAVYRFFELFDLLNVPTAAALFARAAAGQLRVTPPPKPLFEEKMLFALLWNQHLNSFWRQELGESFLKRMRSLSPYTWLVDPSPLPPHAALPRLDITSWEQLEYLSHKERDLILKVSGFSPHAWGARGVYLGSDLSQAGWSAAVRQAMRSFESSPYVLQRYHKPGLVDASYYDFDQKQVIAMKGRVRLCPYYFVSGEGDAARANLGGVLATICPPDKKIIHGMTEAIFAPCST